MIFNIQSCFEVFRVEAKAHINYGLTNMSSTMSNQRSAEFDAYLDSKFYYHSRE